MTDAGPRGAGAEQPPEPRVHPTRDDSIAAALSERIGGPIGDHAAPHRWWTPVRVVLLLTALCFAAGMVQKAPCYGDEWDAQGARYPLMCYSDISPLYIGRGFAEVTWPYSDDEQTRARYEVMEYPVGISYAAWAASEVTHWLSGSPDLSERYRVPVTDLYGMDDVRHDRSLFVAVNAVLLGAFALLAAWFLVRTHRNRPYDALFYAASPVLLLNGLVNWDLYAVAMVAGAVWAWSRDRPVVTGALIGLGTAFKLYPLFLLGGVLIICLRRRAWLDLARVTITGGLVWVAANAPAWLTGPDEWKVFWEFNEDRGADLGSFWLILDQTGFDVTSSFINDFSFWFFAAWCVAVLVLGLAAPSTPRLAQLGFLIVVGFLLVNKVYSPQYVLWLLPLAALARPRWRDQLVWQAGELFYFCSVWWYLGAAWDKEGQLKWHFLQPGSGDDAVFYWLAIVIRILCELYLVVIIARDVLAPEHDPVESSRTPRKSPPSRRELTL